MGSSRVISSEPPLRTVLCGLSMLLTLALGWAEDGAGKAEMKIDDAREVVFVVRGVGEDEHWYANFGRYAPAAVIARRCTSCHDESRPLPHALSDEMGFSFWMPKISDPRIMRNRHIVFNLDRADHSLMLRAPLSVAGGGHSTCSESGREAGEGAVFASAEDPDYPVLRDMIDAGRRHLHERGKRFDMPDFRPRPEWVREMVSFGILPADTDPLRDTIDVTLKTATSASPIRPSSAPPQTIRAPLQPS